MLVLPISSAICERGFSSVNRIKSDARASLHTDTVEDLIRISVEGPKLEDYDAEQDVKVWFSQGKRTRRPNFKSWPEYMEKSPQTVPILLDLKNVQVYVL